MRILVVEDYAPLRRSLSQGLKEAGFSVDESGDGEEGRWYAKSNAYDVIVLDLMLPKLDGISLLKGLRAEGNRSHVIILTARDGVEDRVRGLDLGADDYLVKPFAFDELLARVRALTRRAYNAKNPVIAIGDLEVDTTAKEVRRGGVRIDLTAREYSLLECLALRAGALVTRSELEEHCYDFNADVSSNVIDVYIGYLRKKIERPDKPKLIHTRRGQGYVLAAEEQAAP